MNLNQLFVEYHTGQISEENFAVLEQALSESEDARREFHRSCRLDTLLRLESESLATNKTENSNVNSKLGKKPIRKVSFFRPLAAAATLIVLCALTWAIAEQLRVVAVLTSSEDAVWEKAPTLKEGEALSKGTLRLASGIATLQLVSGTEITLEGPTRLYLKNDIRALLSSGTIIVKTSPERSFFLETKFGQGVSQNSEFVLFSPANDSRFDFESISGTLTVSHDISRQVTQLSSGESATMFPERLDSSVKRETRPVFTRSENIATFRTGGREATFIRNNQVQKWTRPELLTLKKSQNGNGFDQRIAFTFHLGKIQREDVVEAKLKLHLVHSGQGLLSRLKKTNSFSVYGVTNQKRQNWSIEDNWKDAPSPEDGVLLAQFEIPRSQVSGEVSLSTEYLLEFVKQHSGTATTFVIVRDTEPLDGDGPSYIHAVASSAHPEFPGPVLEIKTP